MRKIYLTFLLVLAVSTTGCNHDDNDSPAVNNGPMTGNMDPDNDANNATTDFTEFTKNLLSMAADNTNPVNIDSITFEFNENERAFDDFL